MCPPAKMSRPSARKECPEQKTLYPANGATASAPVAGSQMRGGSAPSSHSPPNITFPLGRTCVCTAPMGQVISASHRPTSAAPGGPIVSGGGGGGSATGTVGVEGVGCGSV